MGLVLGRLGGGVNLALEKGASVTTGGKGRGEVEEVTGVVANVLTTDG